MKKRDEQQFHHIELAQVALAKAGLAFLGADEPDWKLAQRHVNTAKREIDSIVFPKIGG